jgi:uncharacterized membrane protein
MAFSLNDLIPDVDSRAWIGIVIGFVASCLGLSLVHALTVNERRSRKHESMGLTQASCDLTIDDSHAFAQELQYFGGSPRVSDKKPGTPRYCFIDCARGLAICFVTFFHYIWNLRHNGVLDWEIRNHDPHEFFVEIIEFWIFFGVCFVILSEIFHISVHSVYIGFAFVTATCIMWHYWPSQASGVGIIMFCVGISSYVQNKDGMKWGKIFSRIKKLFLVSLSITIVTYILLPDEFVYFGAIHCITLVSILHLPFLMYPQYAIFGTLGIFMYKGFIGDFPLEVRVFRNTVDHMPWFENLGYLVFGVFCGYVGMHKASSYIRCMWGRFKSGIHLEDTVFPYLGRHSLFIFIAHQVVLFPLVKLVTGNPLF